MQLLEWTPIDGGQLTAAVRKNRRELKELGRTSNPEQRESVERAIEDVIELAVDDVDVGNWPGNTLTAFLRSVSVIGRAAVDGDSLAAPNADRRSPETLQRIADLLLAVSISAPKSVDGDVKLEACRFWVASRLMSGITPQDSQAFIGAATEALRVIAVEPAALVTQVQHEVLTYLARQFAARPAEAAPPVVGTGLEPTPANVSTPTAQLDEPGIVPIPDREVHESEVGPLMSDPVIAEPLPIDSSASDDAVALPIDHEGESESSKASDTSSPTPQPAGAPKRPSIRFWNHLFHSEAEVITRFPRAIDDAIMAGESLGDEARTAVSFLAGTKRQFERWMDEGQAPGRHAEFMGPAVKNAQEVSARLLNAKQVHEAFRISNTFAEICKMLLPRNRHVYENMYEGLLLIASRAVAESRLPSGDRNPSQSTGAEVEPLLTDLGNIVRSALGTYFRTREKIFARGRVDAALADRVVNEVVAEYFNKRLRHLLEDNRPQVRDFVRNNMPAVYRLRLPADWANRKQQWEKSLEDAGYADVVKVLRGMGDLVDPDEVGKVPASVREEVSRAAALRDHKRVAELLGPSATELRGYLFGEAQRLLQYRQPSQPQLQDNRAKDTFRRAQELSRSSDSRTLERALVEMQKVWEIDIANLDILDWVAYLEARTGNLQSAEKKLEQAQRRRAPERSFVTDWNLAVLHYDQKDEPATYKLVLPLLESGKADPNLLVVALGLSVKLDDKATFLSTVPRTMSLRYHPLAICIAHETKATARVEELLGQLLAHWRGKWELPSVDQRFNSLEDLQKNAVNKAIVEGQTEQVVRWLEARINRIKTWVPNYLALCSVLETWSQDVDGAFRVLKSRLDMTLRQRRRGTEDEDIRFQRSVNEACDDLLNLCRRTNRKDLGQKAHELCSSAGARQSLLDAFADFAPQPKDPLNDEPPPAPTPDPPAPIALPPSFDPKLADRVMWVNAGLAKIRNVHSYLEKSKEIEEFTRIVAEVGPGESAEAVTIIRNITGVIETFSKTDPENNDDRATRRTLYARVVGYENDLAQLLGRDALSSSVANLITPFRQVLQQVVGDLSRLAGVGPVLDVAIENAFISLESSRSTLVLRVTDKSERPVTDVTLEVMSENASVRTGGGRKRTIPKLESQRSELVSVPIERADGAVDRAKTEITFAISLRASAEGFPDVDLGIKKISVPVKTLSQAIGSNQIPKLFQEGPLWPSAPELFRGRMALLDEIRNSFYGGTQRERYFFDGIRRVGKTSLLNFLPGYLPETVFPVLINFDLLALKGRFSSASALERFSTVIADDVKEKLQLQLDIPSVEAFETDPGKAFKNFLSSFASGVPGRVPLLMVDEFQDLLSEISRTGSGRNRDTLVLDQLRGHLDAGRLAALFTGSVRFDRLARIAGADDRIFGSLKGLSVSFLSPDSVSEVLNAGFGTWCAMPPETAHAVYDWTGGYPWMVQKYGLALVELLNDEHRTVATPKDIEQITNDKILCDDTLFRFWWPVDQLGAAEELLIETLLRSHNTDQPVQIRTFLSEAHRLEQEKFRQAIVNLRACEVFDPTQTEHLRFSGKVLRRWLEQHIQDGQLRIPTATAETVEIRGQAGIFIDHENLFKSLLEISTARGKTVPERNSPARVRWFADILKNIMADAERRVGPLTHRVAVAFWNRPHEAELSDAYHALDFQLKKPEETGKGNEVDFKLADEARRARERAQREGSTLARAVIVTGDGDLSHAARGLKSDGVSVQVVGGSRNTGTNYILVVGQQNFVALDDVVGF